MSSSATTMQPATTSVDAKVTSYRKWMGLGILGLLLVLGWVLMRPGLFVVQPIGAVPEGATMVYLSRGDKLNAVDSADGICLRMATGVSLLCRGMALGQFMNTYEDEILVRLPYSEWMYEMTTDGKQLRLVARWRMGGARRRELGGAAEKNRTGEQRGAAWTEDCE